MAALDTNVVIRLLVGDDMAQARAAEAMVSAEPCTVSMSVLMECEWVLRACYELQAPVIEASLRDFLNLENIIAADTVLAQRVLDAYAAGLDFADALHAAQCPEGQRFVTFDKNFVQRASKAGLRGVTLLKV
ncbi:MAG: PilT protein domain-containing protein [Comamonadaceae bacterium]|nr:MAG: PilT protein domain-containing protein [Comamonadaceae bacterium]